MWYGLTKTGERRMISHEDLMAWAYREDKQFQIGWSQHYEMKDGTRLVKGPTVREAVNAAKLAGWDDIAERLTQELLTA